MNPTKTMEQDLNKLGAMVEKLDVIGTTILPKVKIIVLLMNLFESYEFLVTSLESLESIDPKKLGRSQQLGC
jgi:hypothetical protein